MPKVRPIVYSPYPKTLECQTICGYHSEDCTFSSVILETLSDVGSGVWTSCTAVRSATWANQARFIILITICNSTRTFGKPKRPIVTSNWLIKILFFLFCINTFCTLLRVILTLTLWLNSELGPKQTPLFFHLIIVFVTRIQNCYFGEMWFG